MLALVLYTFFCEINLYGIYWLQACIDDNLELVEFLVENGADVNKGDNEGWTPLHATASCGFLSIARSVLMSYITLNTKTVYFSLFYSFDYVMWYISWSNNDSAPQWDFTSIVLFCPLYCIKTWSISFQVRESYLFIGSTGTSWSCPWRWSPRWAEVLCHRILPPSLWFSMWSDYIRGSLI